MRTRECKSQEFYARTLKSRKVPVSFVIPTVHLSARISAAPNRRIFVKFFISDFYENLWRNSRFG